MQVTAIAGGVGAARFLVGLTRVVDPVDVTVIGNTGDDFSIHGLHISPDLDIVTYTLAGVVSPQGWGFDGDSMVALEHIRDLGGETWFTLGDRDLGTHLARTNWLHQGLPLSEITDRIRIAMGVKSRILPMSDDPVRTRLLTSQGIEREFQDYFVRHRHSEEIERVWFLGAAEAAPGPGVIEAIESATRILVCPSNPVVSVGPILSLPGVRDALAKRRGDVIAITPIVRGAALKGPAARLMPLLGAPPTASGVAEVYADFCSTFVVDASDHTEAAKVEALGVRAVVLDTIMTSADASQRLAEEALAS